MSQEDETTTTKVFKVEVMIIDHDDLGAEEIKLVLENTRYPNHCINPQVMNFDERMVEWHDKHPLNLTAQSAEMYRQMFE